MTAPFDESEAPSVSFAPWERLFMLSQIVDDLDEAVPRECVARVLTACFAVVRYERGRSTQHDAMVAVRRARQAMLDARGEAP